MTLPSALVDVLRKKILFEGVADLGVGQPLVIIGFVFCFFFSKSEKTSAFFFHFFLLRRREGRRENIVVGKKNVIFFPFKPLCTKERSTCLVVCFQSTHLSSSRSCESALRSDWLRAEGRNSFFWTSFSFNRSDDDDDGHMAFRLLFFFFFALVFFPSFSSSFAEG